MQSAAELYKTLFGKNPGDQASLSFLEGLVDEHPYFSLGHFYLTRQAPSATQQRQKAALFFPNKFWLQHCLADHNMEQDPVIVQPVQVETVQHLEIPKVIDIEPSPVAEPLLFEPLHTTDYFASQGIKISAEVKTEDRLGKQLRSFTEWLKTMKKVNYSPANASEPEESFHPVLSMAEKSNTQTEVITESMADILLEQGKTEQAIEIYSKLSLLNPAKSAFFAAKIEQLKDS